MKLRRHRPGQHNVGQRPSSRRRAGHTLVELLVVTTLMALLTMQVAQVWKPLSKGTRELHHRASVSTELRLAVEFLRRDLGGAQDVAQANAKPGVLQIEREHAVAERLAALPPGKPDPGVRYWLKDDRLLRKDQHTGEQFVIGQGLSDFKVETTATGDVQIVLQAGVQPNQHQLTLVWVP